MWCRLVDVYNANHAVLFGCDSLHFVPSYCIGWLVRPIILHWLADASPHIALAGWLAGCRTTPLGSPTSPRLRRKSGSRSTTKDWAHLRTPKPKLTSVIWLSTGAMYDKATVCCHVVAYYWVRVIRRSYWVESLGGAISRARVSMGVTGELAENARAGPHQ